jgi:hypothetical protein
MDSLCLAYLSALELKLTCVWHCDFIRWLRNRYLFIPTAVIVAGYKNKNEFLVFSIFISIRIKVNMCLALCDFIRWLRNRYLFIPTAVIVAGYKNKNGFLVFSIFISIRIKVNMCLALCDFIRWLQNRYLFIPTAVRVTMEIERNGWWVHFALFVRDTFLKFNCVISLSVAAKYWHIGSRFCIICKQMVWDRSCSCWRLL